MRRTLFPGTTTRTTPDDEKLKSKVNKANPQYCIVLSYQLAMLLMIQGMGIGSLCVDGLNDEQRYNVGTAVLVVGKDVAVV
jgi:hypothetical protein